MQCTKTTKMIDKVQEVLAVSLFNTMEVVIWKAAFNMQTHVQLPPAQQFGNYLSNLVRHKLSLRKEEKKSLKKALVAIFITYVCPATYKTLIGRGLYTST